MDPDCAHHLQRSHTPSQAASRSSRRGISRVNFAPAEPLYNSRLPSDMQSCRQCLTQPLSESTHCNMGRPGGELEPVACNDEVVSGDGICASQASCDWLRARARMSGRRLGHKKLEARKRQVPASPLLARPHANALAFVCCTTLRKASSVHPSWPWNRLCNLRNPCGETERSVSGYREGGRGRGFHERWAKIVLGWRHSVPFMSSMLVSSKQGDLDSTRWGRWERACSSRVRSSALSGSLQRRWLKSQVPAELPEDTRGITTLLTRIHRNDESAIFRMGRRVARYPEPT